MEYLRESTSATVMIGPFVGSDGIGLVSLTVSPQLIRLSKNGAAFISTALTDSNFLHDENAFYSGTLDNSDTVILGRLKLAVSISTALPHWQDYMVIPSSEYDVQVLGTAVRQSNVGLWLGTVPNALVSNRVDASVGAMADGVMTSAAIPIGGIINMANVFGVDMSSLSATVADRSPTQALRVLRNRVDTSSGSLIVYREDDTTAAFSAAITENASANPIVEIDPSP